MTRNLYLFVGRSGVGKTSIVNNLCHRHNLKQVESFTDRAPRFKGESGHIFISASDFDFLPEKIACASFAGHRYCTTLKSIDASDCYVIETRGVCEIRERYRTRPVVVIGIHAPMHDIIERMRKRGDPESAIKTRLDSDAVVFEMMKDLCDVVFVNRDLEATVRDVERYIATKEADEKESAFGAQTMGKNDIVEAAVNEYLNGRNACCEDESCIKNTIEAAKESWQTSN